jgi:hypothetical protein
MSPILGVVNEINMVSLEEILEQYEFDQILDDENIERITKEESTVSTVLRVETKNHITLMITIPISVTEIKSGLTG